MKKVVLLYVAAIGVAGLHAQAPALDVVSIKVNRTGSRSSGMGPLPSGGINATNSTLRSLVRWAWELNSLELIGEASWTDEDRFDIVATATGNPDLPQTRALVQAMLADRFKLVVRTESRRMPVYALSIAKADGRLGPGLRRSTVDCTQGFCGSLIDTGTMSSTGISLDDFAKTIAPRAGRITVNRTGLNGTFDVELKYNPDTGAGAASGASALPSFFTAVEEQLGLKLDAQTADVDVFVIASVEKPTAN